MLFFFWEFLADNFNYYTFNSLSLFWLAESVQWIFEISAWLYNNHVKDTQGHRSSCQLMYDGGAWFLRVIMSLCCLPFASLTEQVIEKIVEDKDTQNTKRSMKWLRSCLLITWKRKNWANLRKRESWHKLWKHTFYVEARKKEFVECIIKQLLDSFFGIFRMIKVSVRVISLSR